MEDIKMTKSRIDIAFDIVKENGEPIVSDYYRQHSIDNPFIQVLDSCEYILWNYRMAHKGNCCFCAERRKQELKELVEQLKKK